MIDLKYLETVLRQAKERVDALLSAIHDQEAEQCEKIEVTHCENKDQAQALANFLWNEKQRHLEDVRAINMDLARLSIQWSVNPNHVVAFVKP